VPDVRLGTRAAKELRKLDPQIRRRVLAGLKQLGADEAADIKALVGHPGWLRLRVGEHRMIFRQEDDGAYLVARVVDRRDLDRAVDAL
jgi:mRNA interferase RelE/StbE